MKKTKIAVFCSGGGTNLQALIDARESGILHSGDICLVLANNASAYALTRAENAGIPTAIVVKKQLSQSEFECEVKRILREHGIEMIILAGFMAILSEDFTKSYPKRIINVHPSLIPSFCGKGFYGLYVHEKVLEYGVKITGATVHFVNEIPDGGQIIEQKAVRVRKGDTPQILQRRVMEQAEWKILPKAAEFVARQILIKGDKYEHICN